MTDSERQRKMDFIVEQQARFSENIALSEIRIGRLERVLKLAIRGGLRERKEFRERMNALVNAQILTEESQLRTDQALKDSQFRTDQALANLADAQTRTSKRVDRLEGS
jgi:hypothetical protein